MHNMVQCRDVRPGVTCSRPRTRMVRAQAYEGSSNGAAMAPAAESKATAAARGPKKLPTMTLFKALAFTGPAPGMAVKAMLATNSHVPAFQSASFFQPHRRVNCVVANESLLKFGGA